MKTVDSGRKPRYCGVERNRFWMEMTTASCNLVRFGETDVGNSVNRGTGLAYDGLGKALQL